MFIKLKVIEDIVDILKQFIYTVIMSNTITCSSYRKSQIETETNRLTFIFK